MQISELARQASVSVHALRHYERLGLIRRRANFRLSGVVAAEPLRS